MDARARLGLDTTGLERLETRDNPAGNVTAYWSGGSLVVAGDAADNAIRIDYASRSYDIRITGMDGTTVNGQPSAFLGRPPTGEVADRSARQYPVANLYAHGGAGNDRIEVSGIQSAGDIVLQGGDGNDTIAVENTRSAGATGLSGDAGNDVIAVRNVVAGTYAAADGGDGADAIYNMGMSGGVSTSTYGFEPNTA